ncbi:hypothetical protein SH611_05060 [Geminicoccaceae bacterium 1502E]|nr:hypothetical protein [Geminicoccaceae bacterium 1502E]
MRTARRLLPLAVLAASLAQAAPTAAACLGIVVDSGLAPTTDYDPFAAADQVLDRTLRVRNTGSETCSFRLAFQRQPADPATLGGDLAYTLTEEDDTPLLDDRLATSAPERYLETGPLAQGDEASLTWRWRLGRGQIVTPGARADTVELRLYEAGAASMLDSKTLTLQATVVSSMGMNLAGADVTAPYAYTMDFGTLVTGARREVQIEVRSNQRYELTVLSEHDGRMRLDAPYDQWTVDYEATLDGLLLSFPSTVGPHEPTTLAGTSLPFAVTIGDTGSKRAGLYRDEITISIVPAP